MTLQSAYENLARFALFIEHARLGEATATDELVFIDFAQLQTHPQGGLYGLFCSLHRIAYRLRNAVAGESQPLNTTEVAERLKTFQFGTFSSNAIRHTHDYIVLRALAHLCDKLSAAFTDMATGPDFAVRRH